MKIFNELKIADFFIEFFYLAIIFLVPLYFGFLFITDNPFELQKTVLFRALLFPLIFFSLLKFAGDSNFKTAFTKSFKSYFFWPLLIVVFSVLSLCWSIDHQTAFWGSADRQLGVLSGIYFFLFFLFLSLNLILSSDKRKKIDRLITVVVWSSFFVSLYALAQYFGYDFLNWEEPAHLTKRSISSLGQPNFLGSFLILTIPLNVYLIKKKSGFFFPGLYLLLGLTELAALICSGSRGAWLGLLLAALIAGFYFYFRKNKAIFLSVLALVICSGLVLLLSGGSVGHRFRSAFALNSGSSAVRISLWSSSFSAVKQRWFGYGLDNQAEALISFYQPDWAINNKVNVVVDRGHNLILDHLLTLGVIGLSLFLFFYYLIFKRLNENIKNDDTFLSKALWLALSAYLISLLFNFAVVTTSIYFWAYLALIVSLNFKTELKSEAEVKKLDWISISLLSLAALLALVGIRREMKTLEADYFFLSAKNLFFQGQVPAAILTFTYLDQANPIHNDYHYQLINWVFDNSRDFPDESSRYIALKQIEKYDREMSAAADDSWFYLLARTQTSVLLSDPLAADRTALRLIEKSPHYPLLYFKLAKAEEYRSNPLAAQKYYQRALELLPEENQLDSSINLQALRNFKAAVLKNLIE